MLSRALAAALWPLAVVAVGVVLWALAPLFGG